MSKSSDAGAMSRVVVTAGGALAVLIALAAASAVVHSSKAAWPGTPGNLVVETADGIWTMTPQGRRVRRIDDNTYLSAVRVSRDGKRYLVATAGRLASGDVSLYLLTGAGKAVTLAENGDGPAWMPNGAGFAYVDNGGDCTFHVGVIRLRPRVENPSEQVLATRRARCESDHDPTFSPSGDRIAFTRLTQNAARIYLFNLKSQQVTRLTGGRSPSWSPDGRTVAFYRERAIRTVDLRTRRVTWQAPTADARPVVWAPDSRSIAYTVYTDQGPEIWIVDVTSRKTQRVKAGATVHDWIPQPAR